MYRLNVVDNNLLLGKFTSSMVLVFIQQDIFFTTNELIGLCIIVCPITSTVTVIFRKSLRRNGKQTVKCVVKQKWTSVMHLFD